MLGCIAHTLPGIRPIYRRPLIEEGGHAFRRLGLSRSSGHHRAGKRVLGCRCSSSGYYVFDRGPNLSNDHRNGVRWFRVPADSTRAVLVPRGSGSQLQGVLATKKENPERRGRDDAYSQVRNIHAVIHSFNSFVN